MPNFSNNSSKNSKRINTDDTIDDNYSIINNSHNNSHNFNTLENFDDLDNLDCSKYFQDIYNNIVKNEETVIDNSVCSNCGSKEFVEDQLLGVIVCECGQVIDNLYDYRPETRTFDDDSKQDTNRYNKVTNELLPLSSLGTRLPSNIRGTLQKLHNWSAMPYRERSLYNDFKKINLACDNLNLKKNIQQASNIFYAAAKSCKHEGGDNDGKHIITRGKNNKGIQGGSIWIACKTNNTPIIAKDIAEQFNLTVKELNKGIKSLINLLNIKNMTVQLKVIGSEEYVQKYCTKMNIKEEYMNQAIRIAKNIDRLNIITEHTQFSIAATSVLIMAELNGITGMTKKALKNLFGVSNVTISKTYKKLEHIKHILTDDEKVNKIMEKINVLHKEQEISDEIKQRMEKFGINEKNPVIINSTSTSTSTSTNKSNSNTNKSNSNSKKCNNIPDEIPDEISYEIPDEIIEEPVMKQKEPKKLVKKPKIIIKTTTNNYANNNQNSNMDTIKSKSRF